MARGVTFKASLNTAGLNRYLNKLGDEAEAALRPAAQAGAQVLYDRVKANVGAIGKKTGKLSASIYQAYSVSNSEDGKAAVYHVSWNARKAPHGHLLEYGYLQRYRYYQGDDGQIRPMVRPGMDGKPRPGRRAPQAQKNAYYVTLPFPVWVAPRAFVRNAESEFSAAYKAATAELKRRVLSKTT
ncbi:MAG: HK97 gp10 family phage protein [Pseudorhodoferax sp.]